MELDDLKTAWRTLDERVNASIALNLRVQTEIKLDRARASLRRLAWSPRYELVANVVAAVPIGRFLAGHVHELRFFLPAIVLQATLVALIVAGAKQLSLLAGVDYSAPVVAIQRQLAALYALRLRVSRWTLACGPLLWVPLAIVAAKGLFGVDLYQSVGTTWIVTSLIAGVAAILLALWISQRCADRLHRSSFWRRLSDDLAGRNLAKAMRVVRELAEFAEE